MCFFLVVNGVMGPLYTWPKIYKIYGEAVFFDFTPFFVESMDPTYNCLVGAHLVYVERGLGLWGSEDDGRLKVDRVLPQILGCFIYPHEQCSFHPVWLFDIGDEKLPNYMGIIKSQYKDPVINQSV